MKKKILPITPELLDQLRKGNSEERRNLTLE
jgi:hypothetical protein